MKKILALLLAVVMVASLFAGCGSNKAEEPATTEAKAEAPAANETEAPAAEDNGEIPTLIWYAVGNGEAANLADWTEKVNAYLEEKIGVHLDYRVVGWGDWEQRRNLIVQTNEPYDIMFTNSGTFANDVAMGAFAPLDELMAEVPGLTDLIPTAYLDACRIDGTLYGIPAYKDSSMTNFFVWSEATVNEYYPEYTEAHTLAEVNDGLYKIMEGTNMNPIQLNADGFTSIIGNKYDFAGLGNSGIGIAYNGGTEFVPVYEQEDVINDLKLVHQWYKDGIINSDAPQLTGQPSGMFAMGVAQGWPSAAGAWGAGRQETVVVSQFEDTVVSNDSVQGSISCISASSEHKAEALKLLELVNTDTYLRDMLWYGVEGYDYDYVDADGNKVAFTDDCDKWIKRITNDWTAAGYTQGTFFVSTPEFGSNGNPFVDEVKPQNERAIASPAMGFAFDRTNVADQLTGVAAVYDEYKALVHTGAGDPEVVLPEMMAAMRDAGLDEILAEVNAQFAAWQGK